MKTLQIKGVTNEWVISRQEKRIKNLTDGQDQYKDALRTLNKEVKELKEKLEEGSSKEKRSGSQRDGGEGVDSSIGPGGDGQG